VPERHGEAANLPVPVDCLSKSSLHCESLEDVMDRNQLIHEIGKTIIEAIGSRKPKWRHIVQVVTFEDGSSGINGFVYFEDGRHEPVTPRSFATTKLLEELRAAMAEVDRKAPWRCALIQIDRNTGEIKFDFEYDRADRWAITLQNSSARAIELPPA
jgi:hypothetical protein